MIGLALLAQLTVVSRVPDRAGACEPIEMAIVVTARSQSLPLLLAPPLPGFEVLRAPSAPATWPTAGQPGFRTSEFRYTLATAQTGTIVIPAFEAKVDGATARSEPMRVNIGAATAASASAVVARARVDTSLSVRLHAMSAAETVYVGQQANYEVAVFLAQGVREQLRRNPTFFPPEIPSVLAYDIPALGSRSRGSIGSECFDALVYQRAVFPIMPGRFVIPPAQLAYALPIGSGFFSREETHEAQTDSVVVIAIEPPTAGRPDGFQGAVGSLRVTSRVDATRARVGNSFVLTVRVAGTGNVKLFPRPPLNIPWAAIVRGDERVNIDTSARRVRGSKEFDWVLTPKIAGELDVPPISYSYYDPDRRRYEVVATPSARVNVGRGGLAAEDTLTTDDILTVRKRYRGPVRPPLSDRPLFWALLALMPLPAVGRRWWPRVGWRRTPRAMVVAMPSVPPTGNAARDAATTRRAFVGAIGRRMGYSGQDFTRPGSLVRALRRVGVSKGIAQDAEKLVRELETVAYSGVGDARPSAADDAARLLAAIDTEALPASVFPRRFGRWPMVLLAMAFGARAVVAAIPADAAAVFDRSVQAYEAREYAVARAGFAEVAAAEPRAADAWANFGTAAWMVGDTARAVEGWQRALRFEPLASDMRERVTLLQGLPTMSAGFVPPVPVSGLLLAALVAWAACCFAMWRGEGGRRGVRAAGAGAIVLIAAALAMKTWQSGAHRAVVRSSAALSVEASLGADRGASTIVGEVVRVFEEQSVWTRIMLDDRRTGWVETSSLIRLDR